MVLCSRIIRQPDDPFARERGKGGPIDAQLAEDFRGVLADLRGWLPVSTTHILTSGVAGTMAANGSGLQWGTVKSLALAWVLTLPAAIALSGTLFWVFTKLF